MPSTEWRFYEFPPWDGLTEDSYVESNVKFVDEEKWSSVLVSKHIDPCDPRDLFLPEEIKKATAMLAPHMGDEELTIVLDWDYDAYPSYWSVATELDEFFVTSFDHSIKMISLALCTTGCCDDGDYYPFGLY